MTTFTPPAAATSPTTAADARIPNDHPFARHLRRTARRRIAEPHALWREADGPLPALYLGHGAPMTFEDGHWMRQLHDWAHALPRPKAILIVSAHWESDAPGITSTTPTELVYDFAGFDPMYHRFRYDTPDSSRLADALHSLMPDGRRVVEHRGRGLDHGAWVPLKVMYPEADVPVLQLSLPTQDPQSLLDLGERLRPLREAGVLVIGSGFLTHGLRHLTRASWLQGEVPGWSREFDAWAAEALDRGDVEALAAYDVAPGMPYAHPTVEHLTPLFVAIGAASDPHAPPTTVIEDFAVGLAKRSLQFA